MARSLLFRKLVFALQTVRRENLAAQNLPPPMPESATDWTRRKFIKTTAAVGAAGLAGDVASLSLPMHVRCRRNSRIAIIGAGIAG